MIEPEDIPLIVDAVKSVVDRVIAERMTEVYGVLEEIREQMFNSVTVLSGNDDALLGEIRKVQHATPAEVLEMAGDSWERFIRGEAVKLGIVKVLTKTMPTEATT